MSVLPDFDPPSFGEVVAYLHGVADGVRASRKGSVTLVTCTAPPSAPCTAAVVSIRSGVLSAGTPCDDAAPGPIPRRTMPYVSTAASATVAGGESSVPSSVAGLPADRSSGVCLRVAAPSPEWFRLTGTDDDSAFFPQAR